MIYLIVKIRKLKWKFNRHKIRDNYFKLGYVIEIRNDISKRGKIKISFKCRKLFISESLLSLLSRRIQLYARI